MREAGGGEDNGTAKFSPRAGRHNMSGAEGNI